MLKIKDKDGRTKLVLKDEDEEPRLIDNISIELEENEDEEKSAGARDQRPADEEDEGA